jgi:hypothetical protein
MTFGVFIAICLMAGFIVLMEKPIEAAFSAIGAAFRPVGWIIKWLFARWGEFVVFTILAFGAWEVAKDSIILPAQLIWLLITGEVP